MFDVLSFRWPSRICTQALRRQHLRSTARPDTFGTAHVTLVDSFECFVPN